MGRVGLSCEPTPVSNQFATTQWKIVLEARDGTESQARAALESLCRAHWFPLYAYVRSRGHDADSPPI